LLKAIVPGDKYANMWSDVSRANRKNCFLFM